MAHVLESGVENLVFTSDGFHVGVGNELDNQLVGGTGDDELSGMVGNDVLIGGTGNDILTGGNGADAMTGGSGDDVYDVSDAGDAVTENLDEGNDKVVTSLGSYTLGANVEALKYNGSYAGTGVFVGQGNALANVIEGGDGIDSLIGNGGNDSLYGGAGNDSLNGGADSDNLYGGDGSDTLIGGTEDDNLYGGAGNDTLEGNNGNDALQGNDGNDILNGSAGDDQMAGGAGNDVYYVDSALDQALENAGEGVDEVLAVGNADLSYTLSANVDNLSYAGTGQFNGVGNDIDNLIAGGSGSDTLDGAAGNDTLIGGAGDDTLLGGAGDDTLFGGTGSNVLNGGAGINTVSYADSERAVFASFFTNTTTLRFADPDPALAVHDVLQNISNITGSDFDDQIFGNSQSNVLMGGAGDDLIRGLGGGDVMSGGSGTDRLEGGFSNDTYLVGEDDLGDVIVEAFTPLSLSSGYDTVRILSVGDRAGTTLSYTAPRNTDALIYEGNADFIGSGYDVVGGSGNDTLNGASSASGGAGSDTLAGQLDGGTYDGGAGFDYLDFGINVQPSGIGWTANLTTGVSSNAGAFVDGQIANIEGVRGSNFSDVLLGDGNANMLDGRGNDDVMNGGGGNDTLIGGTGNDFLDGGAGNDLFVFTPGAGTGDIIRDFQTVHLGLPEFDKVDLTAYGPGALIATTLDALGTGTIVTVSGAGHVDSFTVLGVHPAVFDQSDMILA